MRIEIASAVGSGPTGLAAFDDALLQMNVANYNLLRLSSVIPPGSTVARKDRISSVSGTWGDRLYVVMAEYRAETAHAEAWAGIGWAQDESGQGLFVEHEGPSRTRVQEDIHDSLAALLRGRGLDAGSMTTDMLIVGGVCRREPICALALAAYEVQSWQGEAAEHAAGRVRPYVRRPALSGANG